MIPTNMKIGDTFEDGNGRYEVTAITPTGYESKRIAVLKDTSAGATTPVVETPVKTDEKAALDSFNQYTRTEINRLNNTELEKVCDKLGLEKSTGIVMKKAIIDHLGL